MFSKLPRSTRLVLWLSAAAICFIGGVKASAGESPLLGVLVASGSNPITNRTTATPFKIGPAGTLYTIQCFDAGAWFIEGTDAPIGGAFLLPAGAALPTSINNTPNDGGYAVIAVRPANGATAVTCAVFSRKGNE